MTTYLPDTKILINALNGRRGHKDLLRNLVSEGNRLSGCWITVAELFSGIRQTDLPRIEEFLSMLSWRETTPSSMARQAGRWRYDYAQQGVTLAIADTLIAATAFGYGLTLITDNRKHFPINELSLSLFPE